MIDLVLVEFLGGTREVCKAPYCSLKQGNRVYTDFGSGTVLDVETVLEDNRLLELFNAAHNVPKVLAVINELKFEETKE